jgi:hypothetical protein
MRRVCNQPSILPLLFFALLFICPACNAQTQFPDTPAGIQAKAWLDALNAGEAEKYKEFLGKNFYDAIT